MIDVTVVGGGASGIMAAIFAAEKGARVTVLEKETVPMKKLARTGNGKCNISNMQIEDSSFMSNDQKRAYELYKGFDSTQTFAFFEKIGIPVINKGRSELYPACESAASVVKILKLKAQGLGVKIKNSEYVKEISKSGSGFSVRTDTWEYKTDRVIIACGTNASTGYTDELIAEKLAGQYSLKFYKYRPALARLYCSGRCLKKWAGVRVFGVVKLYVNGMYAAEDYGELQLTESGISGIPVFDLSRYVNIVFNMEKYDQELEIDFFPDLSAGELTALIKKIMNNNRGVYNSVKQALLGLLPEKLIDAVIEEGFTEEEAAGRIKKFRLKVNAPSRISESQVCSGGIDLNEITDNMECRKVPGLFFCGEALDADGMCGGYNLQWAWSTGALAGIKASEE